MTKIIIILILVLSNLFISFSYSQEKGNISEQHSDFGTMALAGFGTGAVFSIPAFSMKKPKLEYFCASYSLGSAIGVYFIGSNSKSIKSLSFFTTMIGSATGGIITYAYYKWFFLSTLKKFDDAEAIFGLIVLGPLITPCSSALGYYIGLPKEQNNHALINYNYQKVSISIPQIYLTSNHLNNRKYLTYNINLLNARL